MEGKNQPLAGIKLQLLRHLLTGSPSHVFLDKLSAEQLTSAYQFVWEKTVEIGIHLLGETFSQVEVLKRLRSIEQYKIAVGCSEPQQRCETNACIKENPDCVHQKLKQQIEDLCAFTAETLRVIKS